MLDEAEILKREAAVAAYRCQWKSQGRVQLPGEMAEVMRGPASEGSSSEDTSDEAYAARHKPKEAEERQRFLGLSGVPSGLCSPQAVEPFFKCTFKACSSLKMLMVPCPFQAHQTCLATQAIALLGR
jgi:hypothetical protein